MKNPVHYYTVYENKSDSIVAFGNAEDCAKQMHRSLSSFYCTVNRNRKGLHHKYTIVIDKFSSQSDCQ